jgi:thioesterase domain-containing protein
VVGGRSSFVDDLRHFLKERLPEHLIPSAWVLVDALPVTPNGKVDRRALPEPRELERAPAAAATAPRDEVELRLAQIWEQLLGVAGVGVTEDFFELGGHSLMAVRLRAQIEAAFGTSLPLVTLFQSPTIARQAEALRRRRDLAAAPSSLIPLQSEGAQPPFFCVYPTLGDLRRFCALARWIGPDQPFYALPLPDAYGKLPERICIPHAATRFIAEMRALQPTGPYYLGGFCFGATVAFEIARQLHAAGEPVSLLLMLDPGNLLDGSRQEAGRSRRTGSRVPASAERPSQLLRRLGAVLGRLPHRVGTFAGITGPERSAFFRARVEHYLVWRGGNLLYRLYRGCRPLLPRPCRVAVRDRLWRWTEFEVFLDARREYALQSYPGRLTLVRPHPPEPGTPLDELRSRWQEFSGGPVEIHTVPGEHLTMFDEPHVRVLAATLRECLHRARSRPEEARSA